MTFSNPPSLGIRAILSNSKTLAVVGISDRDRRASKYVSKYMRLAGYIIYPVNPDLDEWNGLEVFDSLVEIPSKVDIVNVFRKAEELLPIAEDAVRISARYLWMQQGIVNHEAAKLASQAGLTVVMDSCIMVEHRNLNLTM